MWTITRNCVAFQVFAPPCFSLFSVRDFDVLLCRTRATLWCCSHQLLHSLVLQESGLNHLNDLLDCPVNQIQSCTKTATRDAANGLPYLCLRCTRSFAARMKRWPWSALQATMIYTPRNNHWSGCHGGWPCSSTIKVVSISMMSSGSLDEWQPTIYQPTNQSINQTNLS